MIKRMTILVAVAALGGCASYTPRENLAAMSSEDICYMEYMQSGNLSQAGKQAIQAEMQRRNDSCASHSAQVKDLYADFMHKQTYLIMDP